MAMLRFWHLWSATLPWFVKGNDWVAVGRGHTCETGAGTARYVNIGTRSSDECRCSCLTTDWCGAIYTKDGQSKSMNDCGLVCGTGLACDFAPPEGRQWQGGSGQCSSAIDRASGDGQYTCLVRKDWEASGVELSGMEDPVEEDSGKEDFGGEDSGKESGHLDIKKIQM